jgi:hypothetical protein
MIVIRKIADSLNRTQVFNNSCGYVALLGQIGLRCLFSALQHPKIKKIGQGSKLS